MVTVTKRVPCPYCGEEKAHKGTCELSIWRSGRLWEVVAIGRAFTTDDRGQAVVTQEKP